MLKTAGECYLATVANYYIVCWEAVLSAILATAWLLVFLVVACGKNGWTYVIDHTIRYNRRV